MKCGKKRGIGRVGLKGENKMRGRWKGGKWNEGM